MRRALARLLLAVTAAVGTAAHAFAADATPPSTNDRSLVGKIVGNRLSVGVRVSHWWLEDSRRYGENGLDNQNPGNFVGSLWGLDAKQGWVPLPFVEYRIVSVVGVGAAYDEVRIKTLDWANDEHVATAGDGDLQLRGLQLWAFGRYANRTRVTPQLRMGWGHYWSAFYEDPGWPPPRWFEVEDTSGWFGGVAVNVRVWSHVGADVAFEHLALSDIAAKAHLLNGGHKNGVFPVSSNVLRLGVTYKF
jgi:opacity protein-like surface antigen